MTESMRTGTNSTKFGGFLSGFPNPPVACSPSEKWLVKLIDADLKRRRRLYDETPPRRRLSRGQIQKNICTLREARDIFSRIEYALPPALGSPEKWERRLEETLEALNTAIDYLSALTEPGRVQDPFIPATVHSLVQTYREFTGKPHYFEVGMAMAKHFSDVLPKKVIDGDVTEWVRTTARRFQLTEDALGKAASGDADSFNAIMKRHAKPHVLDSLCR
jgi:hypothetical protein